MPSLFDSAHVLTPIAKYGPPGASGPYLLTIPRRVQQRQCTTEIQLHL